MHYAAVGHALTEQTVRIQFPKTPGSAIAAGRSTPSHKSPCPAAQGRLQCSLSPEVSLQLQADCAAVFDAVAKIMAGAQRSGIGKLSFVTLQQ